MSIAEQVQEIVAGVLEVDRDQIRPELHFINDLGANSLDIVELIMNLEEQFDLEIPDEVAEQIRLVGDIIDYVRSMVGEDDEVSAEDPRMLIAIASDHAGFSLKEALKGVLNELGYACRDFGPHDGAPVHYPEYAEMVARAVSSGTSRFGVLICGTGLGMSIAANKFRDVRAVLLHSGLEARLSRQHNDANIACFGARIIGSEQARACLEDFLKTEFDPGDDGRHLKRLNRIRFFESSFKR